MRTAAFSDLQKLSGNVKLREMGLTETTNKQSWFDFLNLILILALNDFESFESFVTFDDPYQTGPTIVFFHSL